MSVCVRSVNSCHVSRLQELNLSFGEITEAAALVVAQTVMDKPHMEKVDLNGTHTDSFNTLRPDATCRVPVVIKNLRSYGMFLEKC